MAKAKKISRKRKTRIKKSVRWSFAGVLMATAIIIALIPVQNGGVSAINTNTEVTQGAPDLDTIISNNSIFKDSDTDLSKSMSVAPQGTTTYLGFPLLMADEVSESEFVKKNDRNAVLKIPVDVSTDIFHKYKIYDNNGTDITSTLSAFSGGEEFYIMSDRLPSTDDKFIYQMKSFASTGAPNTIARYAGVDNVYQTGGTVPLSEGSIGYNTSAWNPNYQYRKIEVITYDYEDPDDTTNPPSKVVGTQTYNVCEKAATIEYIADKAFAQDTVGDATNIITISLPGSLKKIGNGAFLGQNYLQEVNGGELLTTIGKRSFQGCSSLNNVSFAINCPLNSIGDGAFANDYNLKSLVLPGSTQKIGSAAFYNCTQLNDAAGDVESQENSTIFSKTKITSDEMQLGDYVFAKCTGLTNIALDWSINKMGKGTFAECPNLSTVVMPGQLTENFAADTFALTNNLKYVRIPDDEKSRYFKNSSGIAEGGNPCIFVTTTNQKQNSDLYDPSANPPDPSLLEDITQNNELFALWGPKNTISSKIHDYAQKYGITYMFRGDDGLIHYELTLNGYTFEFSEKGVILGCTPVTGGSGVLNVSPAETLEIPSKIGGVEMVEIKDSCFEGMLPSKDGYPKNILIPDSIKKIGNNAFKNCAKVEFVGIDTSGVAIGDSAFANNEKLETVSFTQTTATGDTTIGESCFVGNPKLAMVSLRNTGLSQDNINVVNVTSIGKDAFKTGNDSGIIIQGEMRPGYAPYDFAINPDNRTSTGLDSYITYQTGNPDNLKCRYDAEIQKVSLLSYPCSDTVVGQNPDKSPIKIHDLEEKLATYFADNTKPMPSVMENEVLNRYKKIVIPAGIETIEKAKAYTEGVVSQQGLKMMRDLNEKDSQTYNVNGHSTKCDNIHALNDLTFDGIKELPNDSVRNDDNLERVEVHGAIERIGETAFYDCDKLLSAKIGSLGPDGTPLPIKCIDEYAFGSCEQLSSVEIYGNVTDPDLPQTTFYECDSLTHVTFGGENPKDTATVDDPYYWCEGGIIYKYDGAKTYIVEGLPGIENVTAVAEVDEILPGAFENCDKLLTADFSACENLKEVPEKCFYDCDVLESVILPKKCSTIGRRAFDCDVTNTLAKSSKLDVTMLAHEIYVSSNAFENRRNPVPGGKALNTVHSYDSSAAQRYADDMDNVIFLSDVKDDVTVRFVYYVDNEVVIEEVTVPYGTVPPQPTVPVDGRKGYKYAGYWDSQILEALGFKEYRAVYLPDESSSSSGSSTSGSSGSSSSRGTSGSSGSSTSGSSSSSKGSSSSSGSGSSSSSTQKPIVISGAPAPVGMVNPAGLTNPAATGTATNDGSKVATGNTNVVSTTPGISNNGKMSATVNGSSDNYIIKISETQEADEMAKMALSGAFGSLENIRFMPFDISLYDSTGTQKISPVPEGVTVSVTMPIPDDLAIYGGNNKVASTVGGVLETIQPRFTVIDGVPCMNFTVSHLSPYVIYVDTANLTDAGVLDATPKTGDPIHPKWFLCIGLAAMSIFLFLKRDRESVKSAV